MVEAQPIAIVVEDEPQIRRFVRAALESERWHVYEAGTAKQGLLEASAHKPDLVILDLGLPDGDGVDFIRELRTWTSVPVIVLSARTLETDKIVALDAGADDYLSKPFGVGELLARVRVALRHAATNPQGEAVFSVGDLKIDLIRRLVHVGEQEIHLTPIEFKLLSVLIRHAGKVLTHRQLLKEVWGPSRIEQNHYVRIYMAILRQKLEVDPTQPRYLRTEAGVGYRLLSE